MLRFLILALLVPLAPAQAAERRYFIGDFDRIRVEGPFDVRLATRGTPDARVTGTTDGLDLHVDARVLTIRRAVAESGGATRRDAPDPTTIFVRTSDLHGAAVIGGGRLVVEGPLRGTRVDLQVSGSGSITMAELAADQVSVTLLGAGAMTLGGRTSRLRVLSTGAGSIDASALLADEAILRLDGSGATQANARYAADIVATGLGAVTVSGTPKCKIKAPAGAAVTCGGAAR
ncbi:head GIN domain-containing protein [Sphingomonas glacialis]|nr:head GIN domain-containing protein [Sphingomonas glacialis]